MSNNPFKRKTYFEKRVGEFIFKWFLNEKKPKESYLRIETTSGIWGMTLAGSTYTYGYLLAAAKQDRVDQLQGYAMTLFIPSLEITQDQGLCDDIQRSTLKWYKRKDKEAATAAKNVTDEQEQASQAVTAREAAYADASPKERKKMRKEDKEAMREVLDGMRENE